MSNRLLKFCFVESGYPHPHGGGGAGTYVQLVSQELIKKGHQVTVVAAYCPQCGAKQDDCGVDVYRPKFNLPLHWYLSRVPVIQKLALAARTLETDWHIATLINKLHKRKPIDIIEYSDGGNVWLVFRHAIPYVVHLHGSRYTFLRKSKRPVTWGDWLDRQLGLWCIRKADQVISPSQAVLDEVQFEAKEIFPGAVVLPYPLDPRVFIQVNNTSSSTNGKPPRILFAARNDPVKGGAILLQAVPLVHHRFPNVEFYFYGYRPTFEESGGSHITFHPFLPKDQLLEEYAKADLCVVPSLWDNSPNTVYEAMAAGKPLIATKVGGIPELVKDNETGLLVEPGSPEQLATAIKKLLESPDRGVRMGTLAQKHISDLANLSVNVYKRLQIYSRLLPYEPK